MIVLAYDGSADADAAIDHAAALMPGAEIVVITVWEPFLDVLARTGSLGGVASPGESLQNEQEVDAIARDTATKSAERGAERATAAGLNARAEARAMFLGVPGTILGAALELDADVIVVGTRGRTGMKSFLMGSTSHALLQHADRPVLVVPSLM